MSDFIKTTLGQVAVSISIPKSEINKLAIILPGYLDTKDYPHMVRLREDLAQNGYLALCFDPVGIWESGNDVSLYTITNVVKTVNEIIDNYRLKYNLSDIILLGHSLGGLISILVVSENKLISAVVAIMPPYSLFRPRKDKKYIQWQEEGHRISKRDLPNEPEKVKEFKVPYSVAEDSKKYNALEFVKNVKIPLLLITGENDDVVSPADVRMIYDSANEPKAFEVLKGIDHDYRSTDSTIKIVNDVVINFLREKGLI